MTERAQLYTLEGIMASLVVVVGLFFALQATTAMPGATGSLDPQAEQRDRAVARSLLTSVEAETLRTAVLAWNDTGDRFHCAPGDSAFYPGVVESGCGPYGDDPPLPPNDFGNRLESRFGPAYGYNVVVRYEQPSASGDTGEQRLLFQGEPASGAVRESTTLVVTEDQPLYDEHGDPTGTTVGSDPDAFYAPDADSGGEYYNALSVEVVVWRT